MCDDLYGFILIVRNKDSVQLEDRAIKRIIFSTLKCICFIFFKTIWNNLSAAVLPKLFAVSLSNFTHPNPLAPTLKDMAATWCKGKVDKAGNL